MKDPIKKLKIKKTRTILPTAQCNLDTMLKEITARNQHHETLEDKQQGHEEW